MAGSVSTIPPRLRQDAGLFLLTPPVLFIQLAGKALCFGRHAFVCGEQKTGRDIGTGHSSRRIHAGAIRKATWPLSIGLP